MKRNYILSATVIAALIGAAVYFYGGSQAPPGQPPLEGLTAQNVSAVKNAFNVAKDDVMVAHGHCTPLLRRANSVSLKAKTRKTSPGWGLAGTDERHT